MARVARFWVARVRRWNSPGPPLHREAQPGGDSRLLLSAALHAPARGADAAFRGERQSPFWPHFVMPQSASGAVYSRGTRPLAGCPFEKPAGVRALGDGALLEDFRGGYVIHLYLQPRAWARSRGEEREVLARRVPKSTRSSLDHRTLGAEQHPSAWLNNAKAVHREPVEYPVDHAGSTDARLVAVQSGPRHGKRLNHCPRKARRSRG
jgi:hypothetical protein